jgi:hypothetical protein
MDFKEEYSEAYDLAPLETKKLIDKFLKESESLKSKKPLLYYILGSGTPPYKMSKKTSLYVNKTKGQKKCSNCIFTFIKYVENKPICSQIRGTISLDGWCKLWEGK